MNEERIHLDKIYVANFPLNTSERELFLLFSKFGQIENVKIMKDYASGKSKGFAFISFSTPEDSQMAISQLNGTQYKGKMLKVNFAKPSQKSGPVNGNRRPRNFQPNNQKSRRKFGNFGNKRYNTTGVS